MQIVAEGAGFGLAVWLPDSEPAMVRKVLDAGVRTVIVPRVETAEKVERVVRASRYRNEGCTGERSGDRFCPRTRFGKDRGR